MATANYCVRSRQVSFRLNLWKNNMAMTKTNYITKSLSKTKHKPLTTLIMAFTLLVTSSGVSFAQGFQHILTTAQKGDFPTSFAQDLRRGEEAYARGDYATALREWGSLAQHDDAAGQYNLGRMYDSGRGVTQDYRKAVKWYLKSAEQGFATAQFAMGWMYYVGRGVIKDIVYAHRITIARRSD